MSLLDAMLMEPTPLKTPTANAFFVALRNDGVLGSGTQDDPWDGSTVRHSPGPATFEWENLTEDILIWNCIDPTVATVLLLDTWPASVVVNITTPAAHGLVNGDVVRCQNVAPADAAEYFEHDLYILKLSDTRFSFIMAMPPFGITPQSAMTVGRVEFRLDRVLRDFSAENSTLYLGGGVFETRGPRSGWIDPVSGLRMDRYHPRAGQKIIGSGIDITVLKAIVAELPIAHVNYPALGGDDYQQQADWAEVADLTLNANMAAHPWNKPYNVIAKTGMILTGSHLRLRRIRLVDFGTQALSAECFGLGVPGAASLYVKYVNSVVEECIVEHPSPNNVRESSLIGAGSGDSTYPRGCAIRNCVLDGRYADGSLSLPVKIESIQKIAAGLYRITTREPHHRTAANNVRVNGILYFDTIWKNSAALNGVFPIVDVQEKEITYRVPVDPENLPVPEPPVAAGIYSANSAFIGLSFQGPGAGGGTGGMCWGARVHNLNVGSYHDTWSGKDVLYIYNYYSNVYAGVGHILGGPVGGVGFVPLPGTAIAHDGETVWFTALEAHNLSVGNSVTIDNALVPGGSDYTTVNPYNGAKTVSEVVDAFTFKYTASGLTPSYANPIAAPMFRKSGDLNTARRPAAFLDVDQNNATVAIFRTIAAHGLVTGNSVAVSGAIAPDFVTGIYTSSTPFNGTFQVTVIDLFTFKYTMSASARGPVAGAHIFTPSGSSAKPGTPLKKAGDVAIFTCKEPHRLLSGQAAQIQLAFVASTENSAFNGYFEVLEVPATPHVNGFPTSFKYKFKGTPPTGNGEGAPVWREYWRIRHIAIERNVIEVAKTLVSSSPAAGIVNSGGSTDPAQYPRIFRRLLVRENVIRHFESKSDLNRVDGISATNCDKGIVQHNVIDLNSQSEPNWRLVQLTNGEVAFAGNQRASGALIRPYIASSNNVFTDDALDAPIEEATAMGFL